MVTDDLDAPYSLASGDLAAFREKGYIKLRNVLSAETLKHYGEEISRLVIALNRNEIPLAERTTYGRAFLQVGNLWRHSALVETFVRSKRLARIAADLLEVSGVRLYHDQALYKEPGGGITPWHADQYYWPFATDRAVTLWVPLQQTPVEMGALSFCEGSHGLDLERGLEISDESEARISKDVIGAGLQIDESAFDLGEVSYHLGWTFHRAGPNGADRARGVMTMIYIDADMTLAAPTNQNQQSDWERWMPGIGIGERIDTPQNPILFHRPFRSIGK
ncbi:phytanoyl-CoA dioxygenase family protein [Sphingopyxis sp.]|uniref:phytanoyl-CoA dioxygenase family protein n=1 Tax=Sphingopyxis sp. TaxID=1908224 RepID=UPI003D6D79B3